MCWSISTASAVVGLNISGVMGAGGSVSIENGGEKGGGYAYKNSRWCRWGGGRRFAEAPKGRRRAVPGSIGRPGGSVW